MKIIPKEESKSLGLKRFFTGIPCKHGHICERLTSDSICIECKRIKERNKIRKNPAKYKAKSAAYYQANKEELNKKQSEYARVRFNDDPEKVRELARNRMRKWMSNDGNRKKVQESYRARYDANPIKYREKTKRYLAANPHYVFIRKTIERINGRSSLGKFDKRLRIADCEKTLGYTRIEFVSHIESQFKDGMSWGNRSDWHIDHIRPITSFIKNGITDISIINALSNLRPLWAKENLSKGAKF